MCCKQSAVTALADLERFGFITRIRRIRRITTPLGFTTRQITNAYCVHEPASGLGLLATLVFATESNSWTASDHKHEIVKWPREAGDPPLD
jgi:L-alanine-DL-glutamate epimerase-like enolase superfamily enzyme